MGKDYRDYIDWSYGGYDRDTDSLDPAFKCEMVECQFEVFSEDELFDHVYHRDDGTMYWVCPNCGHEQDI